MVEELPAVNEVDESGWKRKVEFEQGKNFLTVRLTAFYSLTHSRFSQLWCNPQYDHSMLGQPDPLPRQSAS